MSESQKDLLTIFLTIATFFGVWLFLGLTMKLSQMDCELNILTSCNKEIRLDTFAIKNGIHVAFAKWYLNSKARQLNGLREIDDLGDVVYLFGEGKRKFLQEYLPSSDVKK